MENICQICAKDPTSHSFRKIAENKGVSIYYTNPTKAKLYYDTEGILNHYENMLIQNKNAKWAWIFDSEGFDVRYAFEVRTGIGIAKLIANKFGNTLDEIKIINPTWHIRTMLAILYPFISDSIKQKILILDDRYYSPVEFI